MQYIRFGDIIEANGKTIRENNLEKQHNLCVGDLVEVKTSEWKGDGACLKIHARMFIVHCGRDCDGTPLYWLSPTPKDRMEDIVVEFPMDGKRYATKRVDELDEEHEECLTMGQKFYYGFYGGFPEESLTKIEMTERIKQGYDSLHWDAANDTIAVEE